MFYKLQTELYRLLRKAAGLTQIELAVASGLSRRSLQRIEIGDKVPTQEEDEAIQMPTDATHGSTTARARRGTPNRRRTCSTSGCGPATARRRATSRRRRPTASPLTPRSRTRPRARRLPTLLKRSRRRILRDRQGRRPPTGRRPFSFPEIPRRYR